MNKKKIGTPDEYGVFTISLDFELYWGVRDKRTIENYSANLTGAHIAIDLMLARFKSFGIHATWSTVGLLMAKNIDEAVEFAPAMLPSYSDNNLSPYQYLNDGWNVDYDHFHFAVDKVSLISKTEGQWIGTHTYSHYYAQENGQTVEQFEADLISAKNIARDIQLKSIVFPRNQWNETYLKVLEEQRIDSYRGNETSWIYQASSSDNQGKIKRGLRLLDSYFNISGHNTVSYSQIAESYPYNIPASRFLRPYSKRLKALERLRILRIKRSMTYAAKNSEVFHLWWHPHNFGINRDENLNVLTIILQHYSYLNKTYGMKSLSMEEVSEAVRAT